MVVAQRGAAGLRRFEAAGQDPSAVFADRARYEEYLPLLGNVSYATRELYWTEPVAPPSASSSGPSSAP